MLPVTALFLWADNVGGLWHRSLLAQDYALINPLQVDSALWSDLPVAPLVPGGLEAQVRLMPRLLALKAMPEDEKLQLLDRVTVQRQHSPFPYFSALFVTKAPLELVAARMTSRMVVRGPGRNEALLRYYDPRVFRHLPWLLGEGQMSHLLLGIESWSWCDGNVGWQQYRSANRVPHSDLRLTTEQWGDLQQLGLLNRCLQRIGRYESCETSSDAVAQSINALLKTAYECHGLIDDSDRCLFAEYGVRFHPEIHRHPAIAERLARVRSTGISYVGACRDLSEAALRRFAEDLRQPQGMSS